MGWKVGEEADVIIAVFKNQHSPDAAKPALYPTGAPGCTSVLRKGWGKAGGRTGLMGRQGRLIFIDSCLIGPLVLSLSHVLFHLVPDILRGGGYGLGFFQDGETSVEGYVVLQLAGACGKPYSFSTSSRL